MADFPKAGETKYKPDTMLPLIEELFREGASIEEIAWELNISVSTIYNWTDPKNKYFKPELLEAIKKGVKVSEGWWKREGRKNLHSDTFSPTLWYMNMKNRFGWSDKLENKEAQGGFSKESVLDDMD